MKLNIGCGRHVLEGWTNVDVQRSPLAKRDPEILSDVRSIPLPDGSAEEVMSIHVFEHFYVWEAPALIQEWRRLLKPGGLIALELPDILKCCRNILQGLESSHHPDQLGLWGLYGDPRDQDPYMCHRWGWSPRTLMKFLAAQGFDHVREEQPKWHPAGKGTRDMRVVAVKNGK